MHHLLKIFFLLYSSCIIGQTFHTSFSDYYFMRPADFAILNNGYAIALNYSHVYDSIESAIIIKTDTQGKRLKDYTFPSKKVNLQGIIPLNDTLLLAYGILKETGKDYFTLYFATLTNNFDLIKELEFDAIKLAICNYCSIQVRATINNSGNIICCASNLNYENENKQGGYFFAITKDLEVLNYNYFNTTEDQVGMNLVNDVVAFPNSDTCLAIIQNRKTLLVDSFANVIDSANNFVYYDSIFIDGIVHRGYLVGRTYAGTFINDHLYIGGFGLFHEQAIIKLDTKMNRLNTRFFGVKQEHPHTAYANCLTSNGENLFGLTVNEWNGYKLFYDPENYMCVRKVDTALNLIWEKKYENDGWSYFPFSIRATPDGGFGILATRNHYETMGQQIEAYFIKADSLGNFDTAMVSVIENICEVNIYPNPGNEYIKVKYEENNPNTVFRLYSSLGKLVLNKQLTNNETTIPTSHLHSGIYIYELRTNGNSVQRGKWIKE